MRYISCKLDDLKKIVLPIGYEGENEHTRVQVDAGEVFKEYPAAVPSLKVHGPTGTIYPAEVTRNGKNVIWDIKASDCAADGSGEAQFTFTLNNVIVKSCIAKIKVYRSIVGGSTPPDPVQDWLDEAQDVLDDLEAAEVHQPMIGVDGYWYTWDQENEEYTKTETKAQGEDGQQGPAGQDGAPGQDATPALITVNYSDLTFPVAKDTQCCHDGLLYYAKQDIQTSEAWTAAHWQQTTVEEQQRLLLNDIAQLPEEKGSYATGIDLDVSDSDGNVILRLEKGNIKTKKFNSGTDAPTQGYGSSEDADLDITDSEGHVILRLSGGGIQTKNFKSDFVRQLANKKWACIGDSLTEHNDKATKNYHDYIHDDTGIYVYNMGHSGCGYAKVGSYGKNFVGIAAEIPADVDVITIFGSGNDANMELDIGTKTDTGSITLCGYINQTLDVIATNFPLVPLGIITPTPWTNSEPSAGDGRMKQYANALAEICEWRGIPYLNLYYCSNLHPGNSTFRTLAYSHDGGAGVHPDENGHKIIAPRFREFLFRLI